MSLYANWTTYNDARQYVSHVTEGYVDPVSDVAIDHAARVLWEMLGQGNHSDELEEMNVSAVIDAACEKFNA